MAVVADTSLIGSPLGDTLDYYFAGAYPILPQPEPIFDLRYYTPYNLQGEPVLREFRTYLILVDLENEDSPTTEMVVKDLGVEKLRKDNLEEGYGTTVGRDKWAKGQLLIYMYAYGEDALVENIRRNFTAIMQRIYQAEKEKIDATAYFKGENRAVMDEIDEKIGVRIRIPATYKTAIVNEDVIWLRDEREKSSSNIMIRRFPYLNQEQLSRKGIKSVRDSLGQYVSSTAPDTYMKINDLDLPMYVNPTQVNGTYALEAKGIWDLKNDFMGGPFVSYLLYNPDSKDLVFVDGFVHAPGTKKRELMQELEYVLNTIKY